MAKIVKMPKGMDFKPNARDYFAAVAMHGLLSSTYVAIEDISKASYRIADSMMEERRK